MVTLVDKSGTDINVGVTQKGVNAFSYNGGGPNVDADWERENAWNAWLYPLGVTLDENDSFVVQIWFTTPANLGVTAGTPLANMGLFKTAEANEKTNGFYNAINTVANPDTPAQLIIWEDDSTFHLNAGVAYNLVINTDYYVIVRHNAATNTGTSELYTASDDVLRSIATLNTAGYSFLLDVAGLSNVSLSVPPSNGRYTNDWGITRIKVDAALDPPTVTIDVPTTIRRTTFTANGEITSIGYSNATTRGFEYGLSQTPTWTESEVGVFGVGTFNLPITGLTAGTTYFIRSFATNIGGTAYSAWIEVDTLPPLPPLPPIPPIPPIPIEPSSVCINTSIGSGVCPNMNYELLIDDVEVTNFESVQITDSLSALSGFTIKIGNPGGEKTHRYSINSRIEFKASWGDQAPQTQIVGFIKQRKFDTGRKRNITLQGLDFGDLLLRKRAWDENKNPISFDNQRASSILQQLIHFVPDISLQLTRAADEPRMDWTTDPTSKFILDEIKAIAEYSGVYEWFFRGTQLIVRPPKTLDASSATFNLIFGRYDKYAGILPELPYVWLLNSNVAEDGGAIRNIYTVQGSTGIEQTARSEVSVQRYGGEFEGYYSDPSITSDQTAFLVARRLTEINGVPRTNVSVAHRGAPGFNTGDIVGVGDENGGFSMLENPYLKVASKTQTYGKTWNCSTQLGTIKRDLSELI